MHRETISIPTGTDAPSDTTTFIENQARYEAELARKISAVRQVADRGNICATRHQTGTKTMKVSARYGMMLSTESRVAFGRFIHLVTPSIVPLVCCEYYCWPLDLR